MAHTSFIRGLVALSTTCITITAVLAQETSPYPFTEAGRTASTSRINYDESLSLDPPAVAGRRLICGSAHFALERGFAYFSTDPDSEYGSATLEFFEEPPRRASVISSSEPVRGEEMERSVVDANWLAGICDVRIATAQAEPLDPNELHEIRVRAREIQIASTPEPAAEEPELICVREPRLGSFIPQETCATQRELDRLQEAAREWMRSDGEWGGLTEVNTID